MACKRKLEFDDMSKVEETDSTSLHGAITFLSPMKESSNGTQFFNGSITDGKTTLKLVGFKPVDQDKIKDLMDKSKPIVFDDCQIRKAKRGNNMEIMLKRSTSIGPSPKKLKVDAMCQDMPISLSELNTKNEYEKTSANVKVIKAKEPTVVKSLGKRVQDIIVADATGTSRCTIWENDVGSLSEGKSYELKRFIIREFENKKYLSKGQEGSFKEIKDIGPTEIYMEPVTEFTIEKAEIVAVQQLDKFRSCLRCKARVEPLRNNLGRCSKEDCQMLQKYTTCPEQMIAKLMIQAGPDVLTLTVTDKITMEKICGIGREISEEALLQAPTLKCVINCHNTIINIENN